MSRIDARTQKKLLMEARKYFKDIQTQDDLNVEPQAGVVVLTKEHIMEWLQVFEDDRIWLDGCNHATVKR